MNRSLLPAAVIVAALLTAAPLTGQEDVPAAAPSDVASVDAIIDAVYESISGPAAEARDWDRFRSLFAPEARLIPAWGDSAGQDFSHLVMSPDGYIERFGLQLEERGFFENEINRVEERYGPIAHAFSTYESRWNADDPEPFARGINSFQLFWDGARWWIVDVYWFGETAAHPIPEEYLPTGATGGGQGADRN